MGRSEGEFCMKRFKTAKQSSATSLMSLVCLTTQENSQVQGAYGILFLPNNEQVQRHPI
jgi:hypothetical protein